MNIQSKLVAVVCACCAMLAIPSSGFAQGTITSGASDFAYNAGAFDTSPSANFRVPSPTDHVFEQGWWYRVSGDAAETSFPVPDTQDYTGNVATLDWADVNARGFAARVVATILEGSPTSARVQIELIITNNTGADLEINAFNMIDFDLQPTAGNDSATLVNANDYIAITTGGSANTAEYRALGANAFLVRPFGANDVGAVLGNGAVEDFDNSGLPFGPGDFTAGFQWTSTILNGASAAYTIVMSVNEPADPLLGSCCLPGTGCIENVVASDCTVQGGVSNGIGSVCTPDPCPSACCLPDTTCQLLDQTTCEGLGGVYTANADCTDTDADGQADLCETCPDDPNKFEPGICGCGVADTDTDADGTADCNDECPDDAAKTAPGTCGCGTADTDTDGDGIADCNDTDDPPAGQGTMCGLCGDGMTMMMSMFIPFALIGWKRSIRRTLRRRR